MSASSGAGIPTPDGVHRRRNPLTGEWILVSAGRDKRPWQGQVEPARRVELPSYDPDCYLCPGNERAGGQVNPGYDTTFVFTNDFAALRPDSPSAPILVDDPLFNARTQRGTCRVICFSPRHDLSLADMSTAEARRVVDLWVDQSAELNEQWQWVQIFENRGAAMGASSPHPHGQIWASAEIPSVVETEAARQRQYFASEGSNLLGEYAARELASGDRVVVADDDWLAVVPYWATWPFETLLIARSGAARFGDLTNGERDSLAAVLGRLLRAYDRLFDRPFPYSMGWHPAPGLDPAPSWTLHAHFYPPLLRADARKFLVGYEMLAESQRDLTAEDAADVLRGALVDGDNGRSPGRRKGDGR